MPCQDVAPCASRGASARRSPGWVMVWQWLCSSSAQGLAFDGILRGGHSRAVMGTARAVWCVAGWAVTVCVPQAGTAGTGHAISSGRSCWEEAWEDQRSLWAWLGGSQQSLALSLASPVMLRGWTKWQQRLPEGFTPLSTPPGGACPPLQPLLHLINACLDRWALHCGHRAALPGWAGTRGEMAVGRALSRFQHRSPW